MFLFPKKAIITLALACICLNALSQLPSPLERDPAIPYFHRNIVSIHGSYVERISSYGMHIERILIPGFKGGFMGKLGVGRSTIDSETSWYVQGVVGGMTGRGAIHFVMYIGYVYFVVPEFVEVGFILNTASIELRYHKPMGRVMVRFGVGWPETVFLGAGYCFGQ